MFLYLSLFSSPSFFSSFSLSLPSLSFTLLFLFIFVSSFFSLFLFFLCPPFFSLLFFSSLLFLLASFFLSTFLPHFFSSLLCSPGPWVQLQSVLLNYYSCSEPGQFSCIFFFQLVKMQLLLTYWCFMDCSWSGKKVPWEVFFNLSVCKRSTLQKR